MEKHFKIFSEFVLANKSLALIIGLQTDFYSWQELISLHVKSQETNASHLGTQPKVPNASAKSMRYRKARNTTWF